MSTHKVGLADMSTHKVGLANVSTHKVGLADMSTHMVGLAKWLCRKIGLSIYCRKYHESGFRLLGLLWRRPCCTFLGWIVLGGF